MGLRLRKRIKILPGVWFNLSKSGISTSIGGKGLTVNLKNGKTKTTVGIPGTGMSYSETSTGNPDDPATGRQAIPAWLWLLIAVVIALVFIVKYYTGGCVALCLELSSCLLHTTTMT